MSWLLRFVSPTRLIAAFCLCLPALLAAQAPRLEWVLDRYIESMGGRARLNDINSVSIEGSMVLPNGMGARVKVMKKRPNFVRSAVLIPPGIRIVSGYDGETAWKQTITPRDNIVEVLNVGEYDAFIREATLEAPLAAEGFNRDQISYLGIVRLEGGMECHHLRIDYPNGAFIENFLDTEKFYERKTVKHEPLPNGEMEVTELFPSDFRFVNGVVFAFRIIKRDQNGDRTEIVFDEVRINPGILNSLFRKPEPMADLYPDQASGED